jgi:hypothetical protein
MCYVGANTGPARGCMEVDLMYLGLEFMLEPPMTLGYHSTQHSPSRIRTCSLRTHACKILLLVYVSFSLPYAHHSMVGGTGDIRAVALRSIISYKMLHLVSSNHICLET